MLKWAKQENQKSYGETLLCSHVIGGKDIQEGDVVKTYNPSDLSDLVSSCPQANETLVHHACHEAQKAFETWSQTPAPLRGAILGKLGSIIEQHKDRLSYFLTREIGKTLKEANGEVQEVIDTCAFFQSEGRRLYGQTVPSEMRNKELFTYRRPYGVVGLITPSNFPIAVPSWKIIPAILAGNVVVWKAAPESPGIAQLFLECLKHAGVPEGVVNLVHGGRQTGEALLKQVDLGLIQKVSFTGSSKVGRIVGEICGRNLQTPSLELGGKNPLVVMEDADLDLAVQGAFWASYGTAGQRCTSAGNMIVHEKIYTDFKNKFLALLNNIKIGNPLADKSVLYGPMIAEHYLKTFLEHESKAKTGDVKLLAGGGRIASMGQGYYVHPYLWENVQAQDWIFQNEVFGPAVSLVKCSSISHAIDLANGTAYGLSSAIYTQNRMYAYEFKQKVKSGMVSINNATTGAEAHLPFGGMKASGNGTRESGIWVLDAYTQWQAVNDELSGKLQLAQMDTEYQPAPQYELNLSCIPKY